MNTISSNIEAVNGRIRRAALACGRDPSEIRLLAVSKAQPIAAVQAAWEAGQGAFGENYVQEAAARMDAVPDAEWHFIGALQSNKTRAVAERFAWVHTVDRLKVAERLSSQRPVSLGLLQVCIQVNVDDDPSKSGCRPDQAQGLAQSIAMLDRLRLRGLMTIPGVGDRKAFSSLREIYDTIRGTGIEMDTLSMGMSADLEVAIAEGSTMIRVGTAIFGARS